MTTTKIEMDQDNAASGRSNIGQDDRGQAGSGAKAKASAAYQAARERSGAALGAVSDRAGRVAGRTSEGIETNPMMALAGGLALGAVLGALLPKTRREEDMLGDYGRRINQTAREAARAAKEAGTTKLDELGYNRENLKQKVDSLRTDAAQIASAAAQQIRGDAKQVAGAAAQEAKGSVQQH